VCMFGPTSDSYNLLHRGTRVRKMHSSIRDTVRTIGDIPIGIVTPETFVPIRTDYRRRRGDSEVSVKATFDDRVAILYYYPGMRPDIVTGLVDAGYRGIVIAGTGLGHVNKPLYGPLRAAIEGGVLIFMTVQTLWGYTQMYVYDTGRDLMHLGIVPLENMLPEVAYMKLCWALGQSDDPEEVKRLMCTPQAGEITPREQPNAYLVFQGGLPEIERFIRDSIM